MNSLKLLILFLPYVCSLDQTLVELGIIPVVGDTAPVDTSASQQCNSPGYTYPTVTVTLLSMFGIFTSSTIGYFIYLFKPIILCYFGNVLEYFTPLQRSDIRFELNYRFWVGDELVSHVSIGDPRPESPQDESEMNPAPSPEIRDRPVIIDIESSDSE